MGLSLIGSWICVLNGTSTSEVDTYLHTRSLRDALPVCGLFNSPVRLFFRYLGKPHVIASITRSPAFSRTMKPVPPFHMSPVLAFVGFGRRALKRSDEHTYELQSLMRISYAVLCLQNNTLSTHHTSINSFSTT